jgi:hypothetical protein
LAVALGLTTALTVAAAPPGFREAAMSDYSLSVSSGDGVNETDGHRSSVWPSSHTGKLLGAGVLGVTLIAGSMFFQKAQDAAKSGQGLVSPSAPLAAPAGEPVPLPAAIVPPPATPVEAPTPPLPKAPSKAERNSRRGTLPKDLPRDIPPAPPPPRVVVEPSPTKAAPAPTATPPNKPKDVDFGI